MKKIDTVKKAHKEIIKVLKKHEGLHNVNISRIESDMEGYLFGVMLSECYGIDIDPKTVNRSDYVKLGEHIDIAQWGEKYSRTISWPDNGKQPEDEYLLRIGFPTGAYIFGYNQEFGSREYPVEFFKTFFDELRSYKPDYSDTSNKVLYWKLENASEIAKQFNSILSKYTEMNKEDHKRRKIERMKQELSKLEARS